MASRELDACLDADAWAALGAEDGAAWRTACVDDWEDMRRDLSDLERQQALESCEAMLELARTASCDTLSELYQP